MLDPVHVDEFVREFQRRGRVVRSCDSDAGLAPDDKPVTLGDRSRGGVGFVFGIQACFGRPGGAGALLYNVSQLVHQQALSIPAP